MCYFVWAIVIVGAGLRPIEQELKAQAAQLGLCNIHFLGFLSGSDKLALIGLCSLPICALRLLVFTAGRRDVWQTGDI